MSYGLDSAIGGLSTTFSPLVVAYVGGNVTGLFYASAICYVYSLVSTYFIIPETKGVSLETISKVPSYKVGEAWASNTRGSLTSSTDAVPTDGSSGSGAA